MSDALAKIEKLIALASNNSNEEEARSAALKACRLITEHGVQLVTAENAKRMAQRPTPPFQGWRPSPYDQWYYTQPDFAAIYEQMKNQQGQK